MDNLYKSLMEIRKLPELYIGKKSLDRLYAYINGFLDCQQRLGYDYHSCLDGFQEFIKEKYNLGTDHDWASLISFFCTTDEAAMRTFWNFFDEFMNSKK